MLRTETPQLLEGSPKSPLGVSRPEQIAPIYVFLASEEASTITGESIAATAGKVVG